MWTLAAHETDESHRSISEREVSALRIHTVWLHLNKIQVHTKLNYVLCLCIARYYWHGGGSRNTSRVLERFNIMTVMVVIWAHTYVKLQALHLRFVCYFSITFLREQINTFSSKITNKRPDTMQERVFPTHITNNRLLQISEKKTTQQTRKLK